MGLINIALWNKAAVARLCWDLANKENKLWIKWAHTYYIKNQEPWKVSKQACWMVRKIMNAKEVLDQMQSISTNTGSKIKSIYHHMIDIQPTIEWKCVMFNNTTRPKAYFIMWLMLHRRLATVDRLERWGLDIPKTYTLCERENETIEHLIT